MHPAYSVIVFTTASGAGLGLLIGLAVGVALGLVPVSGSFGVVGLGLALTLITAGLLASTLHLGRPERAWLAMSQWRTSWLSREGLAALATYVPAGVLGLGWVFAPIVPGQLVIAAALTVICAIVTLWCTGMIYASLPAIRAWKHPLVAPIYVVLGIGTGFVLLVALLMAFGENPKWAAAVAAVALIAGAVLKTLYWSQIASAEKTYTVGAATGLGRFGTVRQLEPPHTQPNFVMREMGYRVARRHADRLRRIAVLLLFVLPVLATLLLLLNLAAFVQLPALVVAIACMSAGVLVERWLFFAEAEHVSMLYYGAQEA
jgi:sulfite dehydrogenase (quinone) subunit SoeC